MCPPRFYEYVKLGKVIPNKKKCLSRGVPFEISPFLIPELHLQTRLAFTDVREGRNKNRSKRISMAERDFIPRVEL